MYSIKQFANMLVKQLKRLTYIIVFCFRSQNVKRMKLEILNTIFSLILKFCRNTYMKFMEHRLRTTEFHCKTYLCAKFHVSTYTKSVL